MSNVSLHAMFDNAVVKQIMQMSQSELLQAEPRAAESHRFTPSTSIRILEGLIQYILAVDNAEEIAINACDRYIKSPHLMNRDMSHVLSLSMNRLVESITTYADTTCDITIIYIISFYPHGFEITDTDGGRHALTNATFIYMINFLITAITNISGDLDEYCEKYDIPHGTLYDEI